MTKTPHDNPFRDDDKEDQRRRAGQLPDELLPGQTNDDPPGTHAAGTPGGGAAAGGLAGTNLGNGSPDDVENLDDALASGLDDHSGDTVDSGDEPQSGRAGGAVGGTPANKRIKPRQQF